MLMMKYASASTRGGMCQPARVAPQVQCTMLSGDVTTSLKSSLCTKVVMVEQSVSAAYLSDAGEKAHYEAVKGHDGLAVALCQVRKEVILPSS